MRITKEKFWQLLHNKLSTPGALVKSQYIHNPFAKPYTSYFLNGKPVAVWSGGKGTFL